MTVVIDVLGHGRVARAFLARLDPARHRLRSIRDSSGLCFIDANAGDAAVVVDCTAPQYDGPGAEAWVEHLETELRGGSTVVTCNKAPLAIAGPRLRTTGTIHATATVGGGTAVLPWLRRLTETGSVERIDAVASGTLSFVCDAVAAGASITDAIEGARRQGFAEPDPRLDLDGTDTLAKAVILHNEVWPDAALDLTSVRRRLTLHAGPIRAIAAAGGTPRAVATIRRGHVGIEVADAPWAAGPPGQAAFRASIGGAVHCIQGPGAGPEVTAGNLLADLERVSPVSRAWVA